MATARGFFITFEGGDGAGKSTQIALLAAALQAQGRIVRQTAEPGGTDEGQAIRALFKTNAKYNWSPASQALLMFADRVMHADRVIKPMLAENAVILCDRFTDSTLAYQHYGAGLSADLIHDLHRMFLQDLQPDLTFVLDIDPKMGLARSSKRAANGNDWFEAQDITFHTRLREGFLEIARTNPQRCVVLDASMPQGDIAALILSTTQERLRA